MYAESEFIGRQAYLACSVKERRGPVSILITWVRTHWNESGGEVRPVCPVIFAQWISEVFGISSSLTLRIVPFANTKLASTSLSFLEGCR